MPHSGFNPNGQPVFSLGKYEWGQFYRWEKQASNDRDVYQVSFFELHTLAQTYAERWV